MKYFKIYKQCARVAKAYVSLTWEQFCDEIIKVAEDRLPAELEDDGEAQEIELDRLYEVAEEETEYNGLDCGDFYLYKRRDDYDMYEIARQNR